MSTLTPENISLLIYGIYGTQSTNQEKELVKATELVVLAKADQADKARIDSLQATVEREHQGMMNWKATAEEKDKQLIDNQAMIEGQREVITDLENRLEGSQARIADNEIMNNYDLFKNNFGERAARECEENIEKFCSDIKNVCDKENANTIMKLKKRIDDVESMLFDALQSQSPAPVSEAPSPTPTELQIREAVEHVVDCEGYDVQDDHQAELVMSVAIATVKYLMASQPTIAASHAGDQKLQDFIQKQEPLGADFAKVLDDNRWKLYGGEKVVQAPKEYDALLVEGCPFCGSDDVSIESNFNTFAAGCNHCGISIGEYSSPRSAARTWNMRQPAPHQPSQEQVRDAVRVCFDNDRACGALPQGWCATCPKNKL